MTTLFGHCLSAPGATPDQYHSLCAREHTDQYGIRHVRGCPKHETETEEVTD